MLCATVLLAFAVGGEAARLSLLDKVHQGRDARELAALPSMLSALAVDGVQETVEDAHGLALTKTSMSVDAASTVLLRAEQLYKGIRVIDGHAILHKTKEHTLNVLSKSNKKATGTKLHVKECSKTFGQIVLGIENDIPMGTIDKLDLNPKGALESLKAECKGPITFEDAETVVYCDESDGFKAKLGYKVVVYDTGLQQPTMPTRIVDVHTGKIVKQWDNVKSMTRYHSKFASIHARSKRQTLTKPRVLPMGKGPGGNYKIGSYAYGTGKGRFLVTAYPNGTCVMNTTYVQVIRTNLVHVPYSFNCSQGNANDSINGAQSPLNDANYIINHAYAMYVDWYGEPALSASGKGRGGALLQAKVRAHYPTATVSESEEYGFAYYGNREIDIPDGSKAVWYPNTANDVLAHELGHWVVEQTSALQGGSSQSAGLNEAICDMTGKAFERYMFGKAGVKWSVGGDITKGKEPIRWMDDPTRAALFNKTSIDNAADFNSGIDSHHSSGVFNKAFYCMSNKFQNDAWDAFDIFYIANTRYWCANTNFTQAAELALTALGDMKAGLWANVPWAYNWVKSSDMVDCFKEVGISCVQNPTATTNTNIDGIGNCNGTAAWSCTVVKAKASVKQHRLAFH